MSDVVIQVEGLGKRYRIGRREGYLTLRDALVKAAKKPFWWISRNGSRVNGISNDERYIWALKDVSFQVKQGEVVGIIGRNGAGKSTLLKLLARITKPTEGHAEVHGRIGSLLEVGTGFHPELTGRENIYLSGVILGMKKREIDKKFDEIVSFAEIEKFIDTPVKFYSSGMYVRLAFAVAAHLEPEILLVDEVLAVGDVAFQRKCLGKMDDVAKAGRTVLFVSHNMGAIENLCDKTILLDAGSIIRQGNSRQTIDYYLEIMLPSAIEGVSLAMRKDRSGNGSLRLTSFHIEDTKGNKLMAARSGMDVVFAFGFQSSNGENPRNVDVGFSISCDRDQMLFVLYSSYVGQMLRSVPPSGTFRCLVPKLPLTPGRYLVGARVVVNSEEADWPWNGVGYIDVESGDFYGTGKESFGGSAPLLVSGMWEVKEG